MRRNNIDEITRIRALGALSHIRQTLDDVIIKRREVIYDEMARTLPERQAKAREEVIARQRAMTKKLLEGGKGRGLIRRRRITRRSLP